MFLRVAVASTDGKYVNDHFGRAKQFLIFDINGSEYQFLELRQNTPSCNLEGTDENKHLKNRGTACRLPSGIGGQNRPGSGALFK